MVRAGQTQSSLFRTRLLTGRSEVQRPPWTDEARVWQHCTSCGDCIRACPEAILVSGPGGTPAIDFDAGPCTFCGACAEACGEDVFTSIQTEPWSLKAVIGETCLNHRGISCRACDDHCDARAIAFRPALGGRHDIAISIEDCTGCGACIGACPAQAITLSEHPNHALKTEEAV